LPISGGHPVRQLHFTPRIDRLNDDVHHLLCYGHRPKGSRQQTVKSELSVLNC
jgi:hypothetical protein